MACMVHRPTCWGAVYPDLAVRLGRRVSSASTSADSSPKSRAVMQAIAASHPSKYSADASWGAPSREPLIALATLRDATPYPPAAPHPGRSADRVEIGYRVSDQLLGGLAVGANLLAE